MHQSLLTIDHVRLERVSHAYGARTVLDAVDLVVPRGERVGLIGENGAGKSTLLRIIAGAEIPDTGVVGRPARVGHLWQEVRADPRDTVARLIEVSIAELRAIERELEDAAGRLDDGPEAAERYSRALAAAESADVWTLDSRRDALLAGLGVDAIPLGTRLDEVSGGQRSRIALAALLLAAPDALVLDEPTNHLDDAAAAFLRTELLAWRGPVIFASHDRAFLDEVATRLVDIDPSRHGVTHFGGGFSDYLEAKAAERERWEEQFGAEQKELKALALAVTVTARDIAWSGKVRDNDKFAKAFKGNRLDAQISRRVRNASGRLDELRENQVRKPPAVLSFGGIPQGSHVLGGDGPLLQLADAAVDGRLAIDRLAIETGSQLLVTGRNGSGKSTLLGVLDGRIKLGRGTLHRRKGLRIGLLEQDVRFADPSRSPRSIYRATLGDGRAEAVPLASLGLIAPRDADRPVGALSTGQQRRLALALIIARPPHLFLLDEPTNHLSLSLATELEEALGGYPGAVVVASHDRWLRRRWDREEVRLRGAA